VDPDRHTTYRDVVADHDMEPTLIDLERQGWDSLCDSTGDAFYGSLMTEDALMVLSNGVVMDRDMVVAALAEAPPWRTYELSDVRLVRTGADSAALVYRGTAYRDGERPEFTGWMSSVYALRDNSWRLALYQQTAIPLVNS
jgi:hypothetical protein